MKLNTLFPHVIGVFSYLSHVDVWIREYGLCATSYLYPSETRSHGLLLEWFISYNRIYSSLPGVSVIDRSKQILFLWQVILDFTVFLPLINVSVRKLRINTVFYSCERCAFAVLSVRSCAFSPKLELLLNKRYKTVWNSTFVLNFLAKLCVSSLYVSTDAYSSAFLYKHSPIHSLIKQKSALLLSYSSSLKYFSQSFTSLVYGPDLLRPLAQKKNNNMANDWWWHLSFTNQWLRY